MMLDSNYVNEDFANAGLQFPYISVRNCQRVAMQLTQLTQNMAEDFQEQISKLASVHQEYVVELNQKTLLHLADMSGAHSGFTASTPFPKVTFNLN